MLIIGLIFMFLENILLLALKTYQDILGIQKFTVQIVALNLFPGPIAILVIHFTFCICFELFYLLLYPCYTLLSSREDYFQLWTREINKTQENGKKFYVREGLIEIEHKNYEKPFRIQHFS